ncbi:MAG TPA: GntR family transcriptional regulator [Gaiellaceae bacterium]|jgi:DNA-binding GntR family transcriptional regulator|nr:GntR family transcriptional regulator [Gaiellaceae bacterium]
MNLAESLTGPRTLAGRAESAIQEAILDGEFAPGTRLTIDELARSLSLSPMPVRDALRNLASTGFVEYAPHRGATVAELSIADLRDTWDARIALETVAIRRAAESFATPHRAQVEASIQRHSVCLQAEDHRSARAAHRELHMGLYRPSAYNWLDRLVGPVWIRSERYRSYALAERGGAKQLAEEHTRLLEACTDHDPNAAADRLYVHLVRTANLVAEKLTGEQLFNETPPLSLGDVGAAESATVPA